MPRDNIKCRLLNEDVTSERFSLGIRVRGSLCIREVGENWVKGGGGSDKLFSIGKKKDRNITKKGIVDKNTYGPPASMLRVE